jgi:copper chaperone NosL
VRKNMRIICFAVLILLLGVAGHGADEQLSPKPSARDKCPVCGMFVAKYPDWIAVMRFHDGSKVFFDGPKDMFKYYLDLKRYAPSKRGSDIESFRVIDYYGLTQVDGSKAYYVIGSDVYGPMGRELVPFETESDAKEFLGDHKGRGVLRFKEISREIVKGLD